MNTVTQTIDLAATPEAVITSACVVHAITVQAPAGGAAIVNLYDDASHPANVVHGATYCYYYGDQETIDGSFDNADGSPSFTEDDDYEASTGLTETLSYAGVKLKSSVVGANSATPPSQGAFGATASTSVRYETTLSFTRGVVVSTSINDTVVTLEYTPAV